jgi:hypothetical protein
MRRETMVQPMSSATLVDEIGEADAVRRWRLEALTRAGYSPYDALVPSDRREVDLHLAGRVLRQGCPPDVALRILLSSREATPCVSETS